MALEPNCKYRSSIQKDCSRVICLMDKFWNRDNPLKQVIDDHLIPLVEISEIRPGLGNSHAKILHNNNDL